MQERNYSIDLIKLIALFAVIALHSTACFQVAWTITLLDFIYETGVIGIPLFFMVSGFFLIPRDNVSWRYSARKIYGIIRFVAIICLLHWAVTGIKNGFSLSLLFSDFWGAFVQRGHFGVFWYFGAMIMLYTLLPLISKLYKCKAGYVSV